MVPVAMDSTHWKFIISNDIYRHGWKLYCQQMPWLSKRKVGTLILTRRLVSAVLSSKVFQWISRQFTKTTGQTKMFSIYLVKSYLNGRSVGDVVKSKKKAVNSLDFQNISTSFKVNRRLSRTKTRENLFRQKPVCEKRIKDLIKVFPLFRSRSRTADGRLVRKTEEKRWN